jgi:hypothetical protein
MSHYLAQLKALLAEKPLPEKLTELTKAPSVSFVSDQRSPIFGDADSDSDRSGPVLRDERRALRRRRSSRTGRPHACRRRKERTDQSATIGNCRRSTAQRTGPTFTPPATPRGSTNRKRTLAPHWGLTPG